MKTGAAAPRCPRLPYTRSLLSRGSQVRVLPGAPSANACDHERATAGRPSERAEVRVVLHRTKAGRARQIPPFLQEIANFFKCHLHEFAALRCSSKAEG